MLLKKKIFLFNSSHWVGIKTEKSRMRDRKNFVQYYKVEKIE